MIFFRAICFNYGDDFTVDNYNLTTRECTDCHYLYVSQSLKNRNDMQPETADYNKENNFT